MTQNDWLKLTKEEIIHWNNVFYQHKTDPNSYFHKYVNKRLDPKLPIQPTVGRVLESIEDDEISILDVGSGPLPFLGRFHPNKNFNLTAVDFLAEEYKLLYQQYQIFPPTIPIKSDASDLKNIFKNKFNIVYARNSIDHTHNPIKCIQEMVEISNRYVILEHKKNEGQVENYKGLHQWNFFKKNSLFYISDKNGKEMCVNDYFPHCLISCDLTVEDEENIPDWLVVKITFQNK